VDKKPVHVLFVLVATTARQHLHLLSRLSFCLRDNSFLALLSQRPEPETLRNKMAEFDQRLNNGE
jgi:PTS system nitrogen regulatory IIA component